MTTDLNAAHAAFQATIAKIETSLLKAETTKSVVYLRILNAMGDLTAVEAYGLLTSDLRDAIKAASFGVTISRTRTLKAFCVANDVDVKATLIEHNGLDGARKFHGLDAPKAAKASSELTKVLSLLKKLTIDQRAGVLVALESDPAVVAAAHDA